MPPLGLYPNSSFLLSFCMSWTTIPSNLDQNAILLGVGHQMSCLPALIPQLVVILYERLWRAKMT